jgi:hypothetical protein
MAFSQSRISNVNVWIDGAELYVAWSSSAPPDTTFQVYVDHRLAWFGRAKQCYVPIPSGASGRNTWVEVGTVAPDEASSDFSGSLTGPGGPGERALLSWLGGTYLDHTGHDDIQGFLVFQSAAASAPVNYSAPVDTIPAYPGGWISDGFGQGGFGQGGFGRAATLSQWTSGPLPSGTWQFAVVPYDRAGNSRGSGQTVSVTIRAAPRPPAMAADGTRLQYSYSGPATRQVTLSWLPSPSASP